MTKKRKSLRDRDRAFDDMIDAIEKAFYWKLARDKARSLHPDFDQLPSW